jgi:hypothetical protein
MENFDWRAYLELNQDLPNGGVTSEKVANDHYYAFGRLEGNDVDNDSDNQDDDDDQDDYDEYEYDGNDDDHIVVYRSIQFPDNTTY